MKKFAHLRFVMEKSVLSFFVFLLLLCSSQRAESQILQGSKTDSLIALAKGQIGTPYKYGTCSPGVSFDCSGFTSYVYGSLGITKCRSSVGYGSLGTAIPIEEALPGDCIIFSGTAAGSKSIGHVGIVIENNENGLKFIHCSSSKNHWGVVITDFYSTSYPKRFIDIRRLYEEKNR